MNRLSQHSLLIGHLLCLTVVLLTVLPALKQPRLEADDYRYLHHIQQVEAGSMGAVEAMTVENSWDHLWFLREEGRIRFFRPTVVLSYALDRGLWGDNYALGLTVSNIWIHLLCCWLVGFLFHRLLGPGLPAIGSSVLFAALATHSECIWYIAGRTDSLAALGFLGAFSLHAAGRRWWALSLFAFGFITKELVIVAPVVFAAYDIWFSGRRMEWKLFAAYGSVVVAVLMLKQAALGGEGSDFVYPYLISPLSPEFLNHLGLQLRSYAGNLVAAEITVPFADAKTVSQLHNPVFPVFGGMLLLVAGWFCRKDRTFWIFVLLGILSWLPTSFVYLSERYLYLPSVAYSGLIGVVLVRCPVKPRYALSGLLFLYAAFHAVKLHARHIEIAAQPGSVSEMVRQMDKVKNEIQDDGYLLLVNLPGQFVRAQFAQDILRVMFDKPGLQVDVLTMMPGQNGTEWKTGDAFPVMGAGVEIQKTGEQDLQLKGRVVAAGQPPHRIQEYGFKAFEWANLQGGLYETSMLEARIACGEPLGATSIEFHFFHSLADAAVLVWQADSSDLNEHPWIRRRNAHVAVVRL